MNPNWFRTVSNSAYRQFQAGSNKKAIGITSVISLSLVGLMLNQPAIESEETKLFFSKEYAKVYTSSLNKYVKNENGGKDAKLENRMIFTRGDVAAHNTESTGIWVSYENNVYDITEFVKIHPGGDKILLAAGKAIDPFWAIFSIHSTKETRELLEDYRIGELMPIEQDDTATTSSQNTGLELLFANEPTRDPSLIVHSSRPCNAEASMESLKTFITPNEKFYVRNHLPVPKIDEKTFKLELEGPGIKEGTSYSLEELKKFPQVQVTASLQCAGNRRKEMNDIKAVKGLRWGGGAISNAVWTGVRLADVLDASGFKVLDLSATDPFPGDVQHVHFDGLEGYGASIPIEKVLDRRGDVILAFQMNGEPIPADHGFPLRALVPGTVAARSVKWVSKISLEQEESPSHWQQRDYKGFSPSADLASSDYSKAHSIQELPVQSSFLMTGDTVKADEHGYINVEGYAISGGGRGINRVDVSGDGGKTWSDATLFPPSQSRGRVWAWTKWTAKLPTAGAKEVELVCKAVDSSYNTQPDNFDGIYNARGVLVSAWQKVKVKVAQK